MTAARDTMTPVVSEKGSVQQPTGASNAPPLVFDWGCGQPTGWGTYGAALARYGAGRVTPYSIAPADAVIGCAHLTPDRIPKGSIILTGLGNQANGARGGLPVPARGAVKRVGVIFSEDTYWPPEAVAKLKAHDLIVAGSTWNADVIRSVCDVPVVIVRQGVDLDLFYPRDIKDAMKARYGIADRFVVFSGGKLEYRKGQDIVVAAFRELLKTVPDAVLMTAWMNSWPNTIRGLDLAGHCIGNPSAGHGPELSTWLVENGIPMENHLDIGPARNDQMPAVLSACDVAVFPNRAEGGTNLVAMEALACGVLTYASSGHGHADLPLHVVTTLPGRRIDGHIAGYTETDGWADVDPISLARLVEARYRPTIEPDMSAWSWERSIANLLDACLT